jgi:hypothetical protein
VKQSTDLGGTVLVAERDCCLQFQAGLILKGESTLKFLPLVEKVVVAGLGRMSMSELVGSMVLRSCCRCNIQDTFVFGICDVQTGPLGDSLLPPGAWPSSHAPDSRDSLPVMFCSSRVASVVPNNQARKVSVSEHDGLQNR